MKVTADEERRVRLPGPVRPGDIFDLQPAGDASYILTRVEKPGTSVRLERRDGYLVAVTGQAITQEETRRELDKFP